MGRRYDHSWGSWYPKEWARQMLGGLGGPRVGKVRQTPTKRDYTGTLTDMLGHPPRPRRQRRKPPRQKIGLSPAGKNHNWGQQTEARINRSWRR